MRASSERENESGGTEKGTCLTYHGPQRHHGSANLLYLQGLLLSNGKVADVHPHLNVRSTT